jgi:hypothetical protein
MSKREELEQIAKEHGGLLQAETAVEWAAAHPTSELHASLEWDDSEAGRQYRIWQMRRIIVLTIRTEDNTPQIISLSIDRVLPKGGYRAMDTVLQKADLRSIALNDALDELDRVEAKYKQLTELASIWTEKRKVRSKHTKRSGASRGRAEPSAAKQA